MSGVGLLCFAASYGVALLLEISRVFFRSSVRNIFILVWLLAALLAHTSYLYYRHWVSVPFDGAESYFLVSAWGLALIYLYLFFFHGRIPFGIIFLPIILLLIGGAAWLKCNATELVPEMNLQPTLWKRLHAGTFFLATLSVSLGFVSGLLYLIQDRRLRRKSPKPRLLTLPSLEWSLSLCRRTLGASMILLGACIFSGLIMLRAARPMHSGSEFAFDPLVGGTLLLFTFLLLFTGLLASGLLKWDGKRIALLTLSAFLLLMCMLILGLFVGTAHWTGTKFTVSNSQVSPAVFMEGQL